VYIIVSIHSQKGLYCAANIRSM